LQLVAKFFHFFFEVKGFCLRDMSTNVTLALQLRCRRGIAQTRMAKSALLTPASETDNGAGITSDIAILWN